ncbi:MAG: MotA/TolQ/ExbB proton channel family protein [Elusimicrobiota bacterium]
MELNIDFLEMLKSSFTLVILFACSMLLITFSLERWWYFRKIASKSSELLAAIEKYLEDGKYKDAAAFCEQIKTPVAEVAKTALLNHARPRAHIEELTTATRMEQRLKMENYLGILGTLGNTAPFIGLFGTVIGIIKAFRDLALSGSSGPSVVAAGISEALVATAGGLAVAIPAVVFYNYFLKRIKDISVDMETAQIRLLVQIAGK